MFHSAGSGKSYTMMGSAENQGIIPRLCNALFDRIDELKVLEPSLTCKVSRHILQTWWEVLCFCLFG